MFTYKKARFPGSSITEQWEEKPARPQHTF